MELKKNKVQLSKRVMKPWHTPSPYLEVTKHGLKQMRYLILIGFILGVFLTVLIIQLFSLF